MPLFMDYHKGLSVSVEDVKKAHMADESVQSKYGVIYHQFWVNEQDGTVFCLMEGPDKESCAAVHREAHGEVACSIVEVEPGFYKLLMGEAHVVDQGHVKRRDGTADTAIRHILVVNICGMSEAKTSTDHPLLKAPSAAKNLALSAITQFGGREVNWLQDNSLVAVFDASHQAVKCAVNLQKDLLSRRGNSKNHDGNDKNHEWNIVFKMGLSSGQPVTEAGELFSEAITLARRLCSVANPNELLISPAILDFCDANELAHDRLHVRILSVREQDFINSLFSIAEQKLSDELFTVDSLSRNIGISRPQLYRRVVSLTGKSPNDFIRDLRMEKALALLRKKAGNISEIALEVGYSNPSYFARCFQVRYGCTPSRFAI